MNQKQKTLFETWNKNIRKETSVHSSVLVDKQSLTSKKILPKNQENQCINFPKRFVSDITNHTVLNDHSSASIKQYNNFSVTDQEHELLGFDKDAGKTWIYPTNYPIREYQFAIVKEALFKNTMVILPTGLGKTFIAAVVMYNLFRWYPQGKVIFMAPTRPLVAQQIEACFKIMGISQDYTTQMTGIMLPEERKHTWKEKRVFFLTPQILANDLACNICPAVYIKCLVVDEAHKAVGNHAYCQVIKGLLSCTSQFRVLALSATPGGDINAVKQVLSNLLIAHVELRTDECDDIRPYSHARNIEKIVIPLGEELLPIKEKFLDIIAVYLKRLTLKGALSIRNPEHLSKFQVLKLKEAFSQNPPENISQKDYGLITADFSFCISLYHAFELLMYYGIRPFYTFLKGVLNGEKGIPHARSELLKNFAFEEMMEDLKEKYSLEEPSIFIAENESSCLKSPRNFKLDKPFLPGHPKLSKLEEIVLNHFQNSQARISDNSVNINTRVMIFSQYRDSVKEITQMLSQHYPLVQVMSFVGQTSSHGSMKFSQKLQLKVVRQFREGGYNTLVSTCVGEEGLDIGEVDLIVCYDATKSPVRLVQRMGRTGRLRQGKIVVLVSEGREDKMHRESEYKKRSIYRAISGSSVFNNLYQKNPSLLPAGLKPECQKMYMKIEYPQKETASKRKRNEKTIKEKTTFALTEEELSYFNVHFKCLEANVPILQRTNFVSLAKNVACKPKEVMFDSPQRKKNHCETSENALSLCNWLPWQNMPQKIYMVTHSLRTCILTEMLEAINSITLDVGSLHYKQYVAPQILEDSMPKNAAQNKTYQYEITSLHKSDKCTVEGIKECEIEFFKEDSKCSEAVNAKNVPIQSSEIDMNCTKMNSSGLCPNYEVRDSIANNSCLLDEALPIVTNRNHESHNLNSNNLSNLFDFVTLSYIDKMHSAGQYKKLIIKPPPLESDLFSSDKEVLSPVDMNTICDKSRIQFLFDVDNEKKCENESGTFPLPINQASDICSFDLKCEDFELSPNITVLPMHSLTSTPRSKQTYSVEMQLKETTNSNHEEFHLSSDVAILPKHSLTTPVSKQVSSIETDLIQNINTSERKCTLNQDMHINVKNILDKSAYSEQAKHDISQYSLTQLAALLDKSEGFSSVHMDERSSFNISPSSPMKNSVESGVDSNKDNDIYGQFDLMFNLESDEEEIICPTPPKKCYFTPANSELESRLSTDCIKPQLSQKFSSTKMHSSTEKVRNVLKQNETQKNFSPFSKVEITEDALSTNNFDELKAPESSKEKCEKISFDLNLCGTISGFSPFSKVDCVKSLLFHNANKITEEKEKLPTNYLLNNTRLCKLGNETNNKLEKNVAAICNTKQFTKIKPLVSVDSDENDFKTAKSKARKQLPSVPNFKGSVNSNQIKNKTKFSKKFIIEEAEVSSSEESEDESEHSLEDYDSSFIDDNSFGLRKQTDEQKLYLQSVKDCIGLPNKFKLKINHASDSNIYSQPIEHSVSEYLKDSFCVGNDIVEYISTTDDDGIQADRLQQKSKKKKRKRIISFSSHSSNDSEYGVHASSFQNNNETKKRKQNNYSQCIEYNEIEGTVSDANLLENINKNPQDFEKSQNHNLNSKTMIEFKSFTTSEHFELNKPQQHPYKYKSETRQRVCSDKMNDVFPSSFMAVQTDKKQIPNAGCEENTHSITNKFSFDIDWTGPTTSSFSLKPQNFLECNKVLCNPSSQFSVIKENFCKSQTLTEKYVSLILVNSRELSGGKTIISLLRNQYKVETVVKQLSVADYIVSKQLAVERVLDTEFLGVQSQSKVTDKIRHVSELYDRFYVIIEKDNRKQSICFNQKGKYQNAALIALINTSIHVLHSDSAEETALLLYELSMQEKKRGFCIDGNINLDKKAQQRFDFYVSFPHINSICAFNFMQGFPILEDFFKCSVQNLQKIGHIHNQRAEGICNYVKTCFKV